MAAAKPTIHEVDFCSRMVSEANILIRQNPSAYPFRDISGRLREGAGSLNAKTCDSTAPTARSICAAK